MRKLSYQKRERLTFFALIAFIFIVLAILFAVCKGDDIIIRPENTAELSSEWTVESTGEVVALPIRMTVNSGESYRISCVLPEDINNGSAAFFNCSYMGVRVYIGGNQIWEFGCKPHLPFGHMNGSAYAIIPLDAEDSGKNFTIEFVNGYNQLSSNIDPVEFGSAGEIKYNLLLNNMWKIMFFVVMVSLSFVAFITGVVHLRVLKDDKNMTFIYFAATSISIGLWIFVDPAIACMFTNKTTVTQFISFTSLLGIGSFYMGLCASLFQNQRKFFSALKYTGYILIIVMILLYVTNIADPTSFLSVICGYAFVYLIVSNVVILFHIKEYPFAKAVLVGTVVLILGITLTVIVFFRNPLHSNADVFFVGSYGLYILVLFVIMLQDEGRMIQDSVTAKTYEKLAFTDVLTGLRNRAALEADIDEIEHHTEEKMKVELFMGDLNFLKQTNDNLGHDYGDRLLKQISECLETVFGKYGKCYRLGGDEFAVLIKNGRLTKDEMLSHLDQELTKRNENSDLTLSIAMGYAGCEFPMVEPDLKQILYRAADQDMYENKLKMKKAMR